LPVPGVKVELTTTLLIRKFELPFADGRTAV
jgi:hypothetical protein